MLVLFFKDIFFLEPFVIFLTFFWVFFIKNNFFNARLNPISSDVLKNSKIIKKVNYLFMINYLNINFIYFFIFIVLFKYDLNNFWFNHLKINNFNYNLVFIIFLLSFFLLNFVKFFKNSNLNYSLDYFSSITNLIVFVPLIFLSNTIYTFLFLLELTSLLILYKFSVSRNWFGSKDNSKKLYFNRVLPKSYLNMLFFQYWANFFSSMLLMFSIFNLIFIFGTSEWGTINILNLSMHNNNYINKNIVVFYIWFSFFIGMFFKIGLTPLHLFKIEVYKGIPFISIFFYTTWYFLSFFLYFIIIIYNNIYNFSYFFNYIFFVFLNVGLFYSIFLLFDVNLTKSFFAYSTVVNALNFIIVLYLIIN